MARSARTPGRIAPSLGRGTRLRIFVHQLSISMLLVACGSGLMAGTDTPGNEPGRTPAPSSSGRPNLLMGTGDRPIAQPFTIEQRLLESVRQGDRASVEKALAKGAPIGAQDDLRRSVVLLAVLDARDLDLVQWLHGKGAALDEADVGGRTPLSYAAGLGLGDTVRYLVANGALVDSRDVRDRTPLFHSALGGYAEVIAYLLDHGAAVDVRDRFGDTPLMIACAKGNREAATLLVERGADRTARDQEGRGVADRAAPGMSMCVAAGER